MKKSPLRQGAPLKAHKPLKAKKRLPVVGKRKKKEIKETARWRRDYLGQNQPCEIGVILRSVATQLWLDPSHPIAMGAHHCHRLATGLHERRKRNTNEFDYLIDEDNLMRACGPCNSWVEDNPRLARYLGLSLRKWQLPSEVPIWNNGPLDFSD